MRLKDRVAIVVGAGQSPGEGIGNGRATALTFAREGAKVLCVDHNLASAQETADMIAAKGGTAAACKADVTKNAEIKKELSDEQMTDLVVTIAFYCAVVRVLATMKMDNEPYYKEVLQQYPIPGVN